MYHTKKLLALALCLALLTGSALAEITPVDDDSADAAALSAAAVGDGETRENADDIESADGDVKLTVVQPQTYAGDSSLAELILPPVSGAADTSDGTATGASDTTSDPDTPQSGNAENTAVTPTDNGQANNTVDAGHADAAETPSQNSDGQTQGADDTAKTPASGEGTTGSETGSADPDNVKTGSDTEGSGNAIGATDSGAETTGSDDTKGEGIETPAKTSEDAAPAAPETPAETEKLEVAPTEALIQPKLASLVVKAPSPIIKEGGSISGSVEVEPGKQITVTLKKKDGTLINSKVCSNTDSEFMFLGLEPGDYVLTFAYEGGAILTVTQKVPEKSEESKQKEIKITKVTPGENKLTVAGTAEPLTAVKVGSEPASVEVIAVSGEDGAFTATLTCSAKTYTGVWAQYGADKTTRVTLAPEGGYVVEDEPEEEYPTFYRGDRYAPLIYRLQQRLKDLGYYTIRVDGIYGSATERAVRLFQQINGLKATGVADSTTQKRLYSKDAKSLYDKLPSDVGYTLYRSNRYQAPVIPLQRRLRELGYYTGSVDGYFGSGTYRAVRNFQHRNGLSVTGAADPVTQQRLYSSAAIPASGGGYVPGPAPSPVTPIDAGYRLLYWGCKGEAVLRLQRALLAAGFTQVRQADGIYGKWTYDAVRAFQRSRGLAVDGIAGRRTQNALYGTHY